MSEYLQEIHTSEESLDTPLSIVHAPNSSLHIEEAKDDMKYESRLESNPTYFLPLCQELHQEFLTENISKELSTIEHEKKRAVLEFLANTHNPHLHGEYQPNYILNKKDFHSVDPSKYTAWYLLSQTSNTQDKNIEFVYHPDLMFFLTQGNESKEQEILENLNNLVKELNCKIFIENLTFDNNTFREVFPWMTDPVQIFNKVKSFSNLGTVIDIEHLEKEGWSKEKINNTIQSLMKESPRKIILHARENTKQTFEKLYLESYKLGVPWINESY